MDAPAAEPTYVEDVLIDLLGRYPWLAAAELVALAGDSRDQVRRTLADLMTDSLVVRRLVQGTYSDLRGWSRLPRCWT
jgi:hypothetical protein